MEKRDTGFKVIAVIALLLATISLTIAYAGYTAILKIDGNATTATVTSNWKILWENLQQTSHTGYATFDGSASKLAISSDKQVISGVIGTLKAPGDSLTYSFDAANRGEINATLSSLTLGTLSCAKDTTASPAATDAQVTSLCSKLTITFTYDGTPFTNISALSSKLALNANSTKPVTMTIAYGTSDTAATELDGPVIVSLSETSFNYVQAAPSAD